MKIRAPQTVRKARIEIIPLIDIIFFLLAAFIFVSLSMVKNQGIPVRLPLASTSAPQDRKGSAVITISNSGELRFNKEKLAFEKLRDRLKEFKNRQRDPKIFIQGDEGAQFGKIVSVLDETRKAGITKTAIQTIRKNDPD